MTEKRPAVFLDRDGTINLDAGYIDRLERFELYPFAMDAIRLFKQAGYLVVNLTNQAGVAHGMYGEDFLATLAAVASASGAPVILMHNRSNPASVEVRQQLGNAYIGSVYENLMEDVKRELLASVDLALMAGVEETRILLDPGIGFGKTREHNLELINRLGEIRALGYPILLGPSRKSFIGFTLDLPADQRVEGTAATISIGIDRGADVIRVHDVKQMARVSKMTDALVR